MTTNILKMDRNKGSKTGPEGVLTARSPGAELQRRLAAVLFADVVESCRLLASDETAAIINFREARDRTLAPIIARTHGRVVRLLGDGAMVEFSSVIDAIECAEAIQIAMVACNENLPTDRRIYYRIGIHFGEVVVDGEDLLGTGVNIAARLEQMSAQGRVLVSERVFAEVEGRTDHKFVFAGSHRLKNLPGLFKVFELANPDFEQDSETAPQLAPISVPSPTAAVALMPFDTSCNDDDERLFVRGLSEELAYRLGRFSELSVVANESTRNYAGDPDDISNIARAMNVEFAVKGTIVSGSESIRVFVRLYDARKSALVWTERYEAKVSEIFELQEEIVHELAGKMPIRIEQTHFIETKKKPTNSLDAYECYLIGKQHYRQKTTESDEYAIAALQRSIEIDPSFADPYAVLGAIRGIRWAYTAWGVDPTEDIYAGRDLIETAVGLNGELARGHAHLGWNYLLTRDFSAASHHLNLGMELNPSDIDTLLLKAYALCYLGEAEEAIRICDELFRLNPQAPLWYSDVVGTAHFIAGAYSESLAAFHRAQSLFPENYGWMAACCSHLGDDADALKFSRKFFTEIDGIWVGPKDASLSARVRWWVETASWFRFEKDAEALASGIRLDI